MGSSERVSRIYFAVTEISISDPKRSAAGRDVVKDHAMHALR